MVAAGLIAGIGEGVAAVPGGLGARTLSAVFDFLAGRAATPPAVIAKGVATTMLARKIRLLMVTAAAGLTALGIGLADDRPATPPGAPPVAGRPAPASASPSRASNLPETPAFAALPNVGTPTVRAVVNEITVQQKRLVELWLNRPQAVAPLPPLDVLEAEPDQPIPPPAAQSLRAVYWRASRHTSSSELTFEDGRLRRAWLNFSGPLEDVLENDIPREVTRVLFANFFRRPLPRWAADAAGRTSESVKAQAGYVRRSREVLDRGRSVRLSVLFKMSEYPEDGADTAAQGYSVALFLLGRSVELTAPVLGDIPLVAPLFKNPILPHNAFMLFVERGVSSGWDEAAKLYGFADLNELEREWITWVKSPKPESVVGKRTTVRAAAVRNANDPPVKLSGQAIADSVILKWSVEKDYLEPKGVVISFRTARDERWRLVPSDAVKENTAQFKSGTAGPVTVRITIRDRAGNVVEAECVVPVPEGR